MVMALGARSGCKKSGRKFPPHHHVGRGAIKIGGRIDHRTATGGEQRGGNRSHNLLQLKRPSGGVTGASTPLLPAAADRRHNAKLRVLRPIERRVDQLRAFIRSSCKNASVSRSVNGMPITSRYTRRTKVPSCLSAGANCGAAVCHPCRST